jgi:hypothetical protein
MQDFATRRSLEADRFPFDQKPAAAPEDDVAQDSHCGKRLKAGQTAEGKIAAFMEQAIQDFGAQCSPSDQFRYHEGRRGVLRWDDGQSEFPGAPSVLASVMPLHLEDSVS